MRKYRIQEVKCDNGDVEYIVQKKGWLFWRTYTEFVGLGESVYQTSDYNEVLSLVERAINLDTKRKKIQTNIIFTK